MTETKTTAETINSYLGDLFSKAKNFLGDFLKSQAPVPPYDVVHRPIHYLEIEDNNPLKPLINKLQGKKAELLKYLNKILPPDIKHLSPDDFEKALSYMVARKELKAGDFLLIKNGEKITYEELEKVAQKVENVSANDASFSKMPRIFVLSEYPPENSPEGFILKKLAESSISSIENLAYATNDSIIIGQKYINGYTAAEVKSIFSHEYGHRLDFATRGMAMAEYNQTKRAHLLLGDKFPGGCGDYLVGGELPENLNDTYFKVKIVKPNDECAKTIQLIMQDGSDAIPMMRKKDNELSRNRELRADAYGVLAGYGDGMIKTINDDYLQTESGSHPSTQSRVEIIKKTMANPEAAKAKLEAELAVFKKRGFYSQDSGHESKIPAAPQKLLPQTPDIAP